MWRNIGSRLMEGLLTALAAAVDQLYQFPASFLVSGLIMRRGRGEPFGLFDVGAFAVAVLCVGVLVRRMYRSPVRSFAGWGRSYRLPEGTVGPTASWLHIALDGLWLWFGIEMWTLVAATPAGMVEEPGIGPGFVIVAGLLLPLHVFFRIKHRDSIENT